MDYVEIRAPEPYSRLIHCVWFLRGSPARHTVQPVVADGRLELVAHLKQPFSLVELDGIRPQHHLLLAGQLTRPVHLLSGGPVEVVGVRLEPSGAMALLGVPLDQFTNAVVPLGEVDAMMAAVFEDAASRPGTPGERAQAVMGALTRRLAGESSSETDFVLRMLGKGSQGSVSSVAREMGISLRTFERRFRAEVGIGPKMFQRVVRFRRAFRRLSGWGPGQWSRAAVESGYYDQAHLIRDFRQFAGEAPSRFYRRQQSLAVAFAEGR
jgi:AraC-like DNA-binding protein